MTDRTRSVMTAHSRQMAERIIATSLPIGQHVRIVGGFGDGITGHIVGARQRAQGPYSSDYPVFYIWTGADVISGYDVGSLDPLMLDTCPYCGPGPCLGSARTTDGRDLERFDFHHPRKRNPDIDAEIASHYLSECHGCGAFGTLEVFGLPTRCPNCGSGEVWSFKPETLLMKEKYAT